MDITSYFKPKAAKKAAAAPVPPKPSEEQKTKKPERKKKLVIDSDDDDDGEGIAKPAPKKLAVKKASATTPPKTKSPAKSKSPRKKEATPKKATPKKEATPKKSPRTKSPAKKKKSPAKKRSKKDEEEPFVVDDDFDDGGDDDLEDIDMDDDDEEDFKQSKKVRKTPEKPAAAKKEVPAPAKAAAAPQAKKAKVEETVEGAVVAKPKWRPGGMPERAPPPMLGLKPLPVGKPNCLYKKVFLCTGVLESLDRDGVENLIKSYSGEVTKSAKVKKLTHAVVGNEPGESKVKLLKERGIPMLNEDELFHLIENEPEGKPDKSFLEKKAKQERIEREGKEQPKAVVEAIKAVDSGKDEGVVQEMWTTKYAPQKSDGLLANPGAIKKVRMFLERWKKPDVVKDKNFKRAVLISGVPGIGKTTTAALLAREAGYEVLEFNASDARSKKRLQAEGFMEIGGNRSLNEFFAPEDKKVVRNKKTLVIMDEVDGMGGGDRGGNQELIALIKMTRVPVICICNDRQKNSVKTLANYCEDVRFQRPQASDIASRMKVIMENEGFKHVDMGALTQLCASVNNDIRQVLNLLQMLRLTTDRLDASHGSFQSSMAEGRHVEQNVFSVVPQLFSGGEKPPSKALDLFFHDYDLMPLFIQENYLGATSLPPKPKPMVMRAYADAADAISYGDLIKDQIMKTNDWSLLPTLGMISTVVPSAMVRGRSGAVAFPSWLGKHSNATKQNRLLKEIQVHMGPKTSGTARNEIRLDYVPALLDPMLRPLQERGAEGIDEVLERMQAYNLTKDDWETLYVLSGKEEDIAKIDSKVKAAFTRKYNKTQKRLTVAPVATKGGKGKKSRLADDESEFLNKEAEEYNNGGGAESDDEDSDDAIGKNDAFIKVKPKPKAKSKASGKADGAKPPAKKKSKK